jgi:hypothetical protein
MMAGQSPFALTNIGAAGLGVIASKAEKEKQKNTLANYKAVHGASAVQIAERLMADDPSLSFEDALEKGTLLSGGSTKQDLADAKTAAVAATNLKNFQTAKTQLDKDYALYEGGSTPTSRAKMAEKNKKVAELYNTFKIPMQQNVPSAVPALKVVGVEKKP